jgi:hypothetical protein
MMSPTIRSLVIPVSDLDAAKAVYSALLGQPHTDESYYVGYAIDCSRLAPLSATRRVRSHQGRASAYSLTQTATRSACAESSRHVGAPRTYRSRRANLRIDAQ